MEMLVFGHGGMPLLVFPTSQGRFYEYEDRGMIGALSPKIERGELQVRFEEGIFYLLYGERRLPIAPGTYRYVLEIALKNLADQKNEDFYAELQSILTALEYLKAFDNAGVTSTGAGILVLEDMLGLSPRVPKFVKRYGELGPGIEKAVADYAADVRARAFPGPEHVYPMKTKKP